MTYLLVLGELLLLFLLSRSLSRLLSQTFYILLRSQRLTVYFVAIFFFPGVVIHEVSHWLMAQILFVPTGKMEFFPVLRGSELKLGSVAIAQTDPIRRAFIGIAPFLVGTTVILCFLFFYQGLQLIPQEFRLLIVGYVIFEIGNTMFSSRKDLEGTLEIAFAVGIVGVILYFLGVRIPGEWVGFFQTGQILSLTQQASIFLLIPVALDVVFILLLWLILKFMR